MALELPCAAEADVRRADAAPREDGREAREREHPVERLLLFVSGGEEGKEAQHRGNDDCVQRPAFAVDVCKESWSLPLLRQCRQRTRTAIDGRVANTENRDHDNDVHHRGEGLDAGIFDRDHERRGSGSSLSVCDMWRKRAYGNRLCICFALAVQQSWIVICNKCAHEEQTHDVEEGDSPEDLEDIRVN